MSELEKPTRPSLSLFREKSLVVEKTPAGIDGKIIESIRSNRCAFQFMGDDLVVRSKYIHHALRFAAHLYKDLNTHGPVGVRRVEWSDMWADAQTSYDKEYNPESWIQLYINGENVFATHRSPHSDIIEKCAAVGNVENYDETLGVTERLFAESGRHIDIKSTSVLTATVKESPKELTVGLIHRKDRIDTIFSMIINHEPNKAAFWQGMLLAADFLEIINLTFQFNAFKRRRKIAASTMSPLETVTAKAAQQRRRDLEQGITAFEQTHAARYRPERPTFAESDDPVL